MWFTRVNMIHIGDRAYVNISVETEVNTRCQQFISGFNAKFMC